MNSRKEKEKMVFKSVPILIPKKIFKKGHYTCSTRIEFKNFTLREELRRLF